jgi:hypothetical protein
MARLLFSRFIPTGGDKHPLGKDDVTFGWVWCAPVVVALVFSLLAVKFFINLPNSLFQWPSVAFTRLFILIFLSFFCLNAFYHWWGFYRGLGSIVDSTAPSRLSSMFFITGSYALACPLLFAPLLKTKGAACVNIQDALLSWATSTLAPVVFIVLVGLLLTYLIACVLQRCRYSPTPAIHVGFVLVFGLVLLYLGFALLHVAGPWGPWAACQPGWYPLSEVDPQCASHVNLYTFTITLVIFFSAAMVFSWWLTLTLSLILYGRGGATPGALSLGLRLIDFLLLCLAWVPPIVALATLRVWSFPYEDGARRFVTALLVQ